MNDLDERVVNWWRVVRDRPDEIQRLIALTPMSRAEFERAMLDAETDPVRRALDFTIVVMQAMAGRNDTRWWSVRYSGRHPGWRAGLDHRLVRVAERFPRRSN